MPIFNKKNTTFLFIFLAFFAFNSSLLTMDLAQQFNELTLHGLELLDYDDDSQEEPYSRNIPSRRVQSSAILFEQMTKVLASLPQEAELMFHAFHLSNRVINPYFSKLQEKVPFDIILSMKIRLFDLAIKYEKINHQATLLCALYLSLTRLEEKALTEKPGFSELFENLTTIIQPSERTKRVIGSLSNGNLTGINWTSINLSAHGIFHIFAFIYQNQSTNVSISFAELIEQLKRLCSGASRIDQQRELSFYIRTIISMLEKVTTLDLTHFSKKTIQEKCVNLRYRGFERLTEQDCIDLFESFQCLKNLHELKLEGNQIGSMPDYLLGILFPTISKIPNLSILNLINCSLSQLDKQKLEFFADSIANCKKLITICLRGNNLEQLPEDLAKIVASGLADCSSLRLIFMNTDLSPTQTTILKIQQAFALQKQNLPPP